VRAFTPDIKRLGFEAHNSPTSEAKFKNEHSYTATLKTSSRGARDTFTFASFKTQQPKQIWITLSNEKHFVMSAISKRSNSDNRSDPPPPPHTTKQTKKE